MSGLLRMRWKPRSIRSLFESDEAGVPSSLEQDRVGEALLPLGSGLMGLQHAIRVGLAGTGQNTQLGVVGTRFSRSNPDPEKNAQGSANSPEETDDLAQPSQGDRVPEDMATLVLDRPAMGVGAASRPNAKLNPHLLDDSSDAAIMLRVAAGDESGFNYLVEKHYRAMVHFLFRMVRTQAVAEELAQEVFLRVYRSRESYRAEAKFTTWLYRIGTNLAVNYARDTKHERTAQTVYLDQPDQETGTTPDVADDDLTAEQQMLRNERMAAIRQQVMALPERQRMAVLMHKYQGMDYKQIGEILRLSESATKSLLFRAYQTLRERLKEFV